MESYKVPILAHFFKIYKSLILYSFTPKYTTTHRALLKRILQNTHDYDIYIL